MSDVRADQPLADHVYHAITDDIIAGRLAPETPLGQIALAERFSVSRTPVREALTRLATDGLVRLVPARGYFVNDLSRNDVQDVYAVRYALESLALREAFDRYTTSDLQRVRALAVRPLAGTSSQDVFEATLQFHRRLAAPSRNAYLLEVLGGVWTHPIQRRISLYHRPSEERIREFVADHTAIVDCVENHDLEGALKLLYKCHSLNGDQPHFIDLNNSEDTE